MNITKNKLLPLALIIILLAGYPAFAKSPGNTAVISNYYKTGQFADALKQIEKFIEKEPANYEYRYHYGYCLYKSGKREESREYFKGLLNDEWLPQEYSKKIRGILYDLSESREEKNQFKKDPESISGSMAAGRSFLILPEGSFGLLTGRILDIESGMYKISVVYNNGHEESDSPSHYHWQYGINMQYLFSYKFGMQFGIQKCITYQRLSVGGGEYQSDSWGGRFIDCYNPYIGCVYNLEATADLAWFLGFRLGYLSGTIQPLIAFFDYYDEIPFGLSVDGINTGLGLGICGITKNVFVYGMSFYWYYNYYFMKEQIYFNLDKNFSVNTFNLYLFLGFKI